MAGRWAPWHWAIRWRPDAAQAIAALHNAGLKTALVTGDQRAGRAAGRA